MNRRWPKVGDRFAVETVRVGSPRNGFRSATGTVTGLDGTECHRVGKDEAHPRHPDPGRKERADKPCTVKDCPLPATHHVEITAALSIGDNWDKKRSWRHILLSCEQHAKSARLRAQILNVGEAR